MKFTYLPSQSPGKPADLNLLSLLLRAANTDRINAQRIDVLPVHAHASNLRISAYNPPKT